MSQSDWNYLGYQAQEEIRMMQFWKAIKMAPPNQIHHYAAAMYAPPSADAPTYEGDVPYIGVTPPPSSVHPTIHSHPLHTHVPTASVSSSTDSAPEHIT